MTTISFSLPDDITAWIEAQSNAGGYASASDVLCDLVERERTRQAAIEKLQQLIDDGLASGVSHRSFDEIIADVRQRAQAGGLIDG
jgi:antitoxin ParD1/3/4